MIKKMSELVERNGYEKNRHCGMALQYISQKVLLIRKAFKDESVKMKHEEGHMRVFDILRYVGNWWGQFCLEDTCNSLLDIWEEEHPEYIGKIRHWTESGKIPEDNDLQTLCRIYQERLQPRPCYYRTKA